MQKKARKYVRLTLPEGHITKEWEAAVIEQFYQALPEDSYLKKLLKGAVEYCTVCITIDDTLPMARFEDMYHSAKEQAEQKEIEFNATRQQLFQALQEVARQQADVNTLREELHRREEFISSLLGLARQMERLTRPSQLTPQPVHQ